MRRRPALKVLVPAVVIGLVATFALVGALSGGRSAVSPDLSRSVAAPGPLVESDGVAARTASGASGQEAGSGAVAAAVPPASAPSAHHLLRLGDLSLLVADGALLSTVDRITGMTEAMGGYVMSSAMGSDPNRPPAEPLPMDDPATSSDGSLVAPGPSGNAYATLTVRVPERSFDAALRRFAALGEVRSVSTSSEDVTSQYVDLQARLRHAHAVEKRLERFLAQTSTISQMLAVQDRIDRVQLNIEQLSAQLKALNETTSYGTLTVYVTEKSASHAAAAGSGFGDTFWNSLQLLGRGARVTGLVLTALLPFAVVFGGLGLAAWYVTRRVRRGRRQSSLPA